MSNSIKHSPGPWHYDRDAREIWRNDTTPVGLAGLFSGDDMGDEDEMTADGYLMAAAPDMYSEIAKQISWLEHIRPQMTGRVSGAVLLGVDQSIKYMRSVLAKARGGI